MPKVNVYLPDDLASAVRNANIPVSAVCQQALEHAVRQATALHEGARSAPPASLPKGVRLPLRSTARLTTAVELAYNQARDRGHGFVGTEHLLLGMLDEGENLGVRVVASMDVVPGDLRAELEAAMHLLHAGATGGEPEPTAAAHRALELMVHEAKQLRHNYLGCEHLLLGLIREGEGLAGQVLRTMGLDVSVVRRAVLHTLTGFVHARANPATAQPRDIEGLLTDISTRLAALESRLGGS